MAQSGTPITFEAECEKCGLQFTVPIDRFKDKSYINWLMSGLGLQYTKEGLESIIETTSQEFYNNIKHEIQAAAACSQCDLRVSGNKNPNCVSNCRRGVCGPLKQTLENNHTTSCIDWKCATYNGMDPEKIDPKKITLPAALVAMYLPSFMAQSYTSPAEADMSAFLNLLERCLPFKNKIADMQLLNKVRDSRNAIMHSGTMRMDTAELNVHLSNYIALLEDKQHLQGDTKCKEAIENIKKLVDADVEVKLVTEVEQKVLENVNQSHDMEIKAIRKTLKSNQCSTEDMKKLKKATKELEERQAKLKVLHEVYKMDTTDIDKRKSECTTLYEVVEDVERSKERTISQAHETQLKDLEKHLEVERNKSAKIQQSFEENQNKIDALQKKLNKKQTLEEVLEKHLTPLKKDMRDLKKRINTVEHQTKGFASSHKVSEAYVNVTGTTGTIHQQQSASGKEMPIGIQENSFAQELPVEIKVKEKKRIKLECQLTKPDKSVTWFNDDAEITANDHLNITVAADTHQIVITRSTLDDAGRYSCVCGDARTECLVTVEELPTEIKTKLCDVEVKENEIIKLECQLTKPDKPVTWLKDDTEITTDHHLNITMDADTHQIVISQATVDDAGQYACVYGDVRTNCAVSVEELPTDIKAKLCDVKVKDNEIIKLQCKLTKPDKPVTWLKDGTEVTTDHHLNITMDADTHQIVISQATVDDAGKYSCVYGDVRTECFVAVEGDISRLCKEKAADLDKYEDSRKELQKRLTKVERDMQMALTQEKKAHENIITKLSQEKDRHCSELENKQKSILNKHELEKKDAQQAYDKMQTKYEERLFVLQRDNDNALLKAEQQRQQLTAAERENQQQTKALAALRKDKDTFEVEKNELHARNDKLQGDISRLCKEKAADLDKYEDSRKELQKRLTKVERDMQMALTQEKKAHENIIKNLSQEKDRQCSELENKQKSILNKHELEKKDAQQAYDKMQTKYEERLFVLQRDNDNALIKAEQQRQQGEKEKSTLQQKNTNLSKDLTAANVKYERLKIESQTRQEQDKSSISDLQSELKNLRSRFEQTCETNKKGIKKLISKRLAIVRQCDDLTARPTQAEKTRDNIHKELTVIKSEIDMKVTEVGTIRVRTAGDRKTCLIAGSALLPGDKLVLTDYYNDKIKLLNLQTSKVTSQLNFSWTPWKMASITADQVAVTRWQPDKIAFVTVTSVLKLDREMHVDGSCTGIVYHNGRLIVAFHYPSKIEIMNLHGTVEKKIDCSTIFIGPTRITLNPTQNAIYVCESENHIVKRLGLGGEVEAEYEDEQLDSPRGIIVDQQGRVIVCGWGSDNIHLLTADLAKIKLLVKDGLDRPQSLSLCHSTGRLYVGSVDDNLSVYQLS